MVEILLFCTPGQAYEGMDLETTARAYTKMAIRDYDRLIEFDEAYLPFAETPDYAAKVGVSGKRDLMLTLFARQQIKRVGNVRGNIQSSSYLFNPESGLEGLLLPGLDVVQLEGHNNIESAAAEIRRFYQSYGWAVKTLEGGIAERLKVKPALERLGPELEIYDPIKLMRIAEELALGKPQSPC
jgi:hypothetical protein